MNENISNFILHKKYQLRSFRLSNLGFHVKLSKDISYYSFAYVPGANVGDVAGYAPKGDYPIKSDNVINSGYRSTFASPRGWCKLPKNLLR